MKSLELAWPSDVAIGGVGVQAILLLWKHGEEG